MRYRVWLDRKDAHGSTKKFMTEAVQKSKVIVALVSSNYAASENCRFELDVAVKLKKKIVFVNAGDADFRPADTETYTGAGAKHATWLRSIIKDELWSSLNVASKAIAKAGTIGQTGAIGRTFVTIAKAKAQVEASAADIDYAAAKRDAISGPKRRLDGEFAK